MVPLTTAAPHSRHLRMLPYAVAGVVNSMVLIDDERHLVAAFGENALYLAAHLAVTYYNRFHNFRVFCKSCKDSDFIILSNKIARAGGMGCAIFAKFNTFVSIYINFLFT